MVEKEPNAAADQAQQLTVPAHVTGQFYPARDADWYQFSAKKGEIYWIEVTSQRRGLDTDAVMLIQRVTKNDKGEETVADVTFVDDPGDRNGRIGGDYDDTTDDPSYRFTANEDAVYRVMVRDQFGDSQSTPHAVYELAIRKEQPDYRLLALPKQIKTANANEVKMFSPVLRRSDTMLMEVRVLRRDGFNGEVEVAVTGLPAEVSCPKVTVAAGQTSANLVFAATEKAKTWSGPIQITGTSEVDGTKLVRPARVGTVVWNTANRTQIAAGFRSSKELWLSIVDVENGAALVQVGEDQVLETSLGGKLEVPVKIARGEGLGGDLKFVATSVPGEIKPGDLTIKAAEKESKLVLAITNAKAKPGLYNFYLRADSKGKRPRNTVAITVAEEQQKYLDGLVKSLAEETKKVTAAKDAAVKQSQQDDQQLKTVQQKRDTMVKAVTAAENVVKAATGKRAAAKKAADEAAALKAAEAAEAAAAAAAEEAAAEEPAEEAAAEEPAEEDAAEEPAEEAAAEKPAEEAAGDDKE